MERKEFSCEEGHMYRSPSKVRVRRERRSLGDFLFSYHEERPVKDSGTLNFSIGKITPKKGDHVKADSSNVTDTRTNDEFNRKRSKSFEEFCNLSGNALEPRNNSECGKELSEFLYNLWTNQQLCDIVIRVNGQEFLAHKLALAAHSEKFTSLYCERQRLPATLSEINLLNGTAEATEALLSYIYTNDLHLTESNIEPIIVCAKQLGITSALSLCRKFLLNFNSSNVLHLIQIAEKHGFADILESMEATVFDNFATISKLESFLKSPFEIVIKILTRDSLKVKVFRELDIFFAIVAWIDYNRQERLQYAPQLLECVRFSNISAEDIVRYVEVHSIFFQIPRCKDMLYKAFKLHACRKDHDFKVPFPEHYLPQNRFVNMDLAGQNSSYSCREINPSQGHSTNGTNTLDLANKIPNPRSQAAPSLPYHQPSSAFTSPESKHYTRNHTGILPSNQQSSSTAVSPESKQIVPPQVRRPGASQQKNRTGSQQTSTNPTIPYSKFYPQSLPVPPRPTTVLTVGGINPFSADTIYSSKLVEQFNPKTNHWHLVSTLPEPRHHLGATSLDGFLYIVGGSVFLPEEPENLANPTNTCFRYCPERNYWNPIAALKTSRMYHGLAALEGVLYAVGGHDVDGRPLNTVEYYNPDTDSWGFAEDMTEAKIGMSTVGFHGVLYVVGGFYETPNDKFVLDTVECYDPRTNSWTMKRPLPIPCCHSNLVVAQDALYLIGGSDMAEMSSSVTSLSSIFRYKEHEDIWEKVANMMIPRHDAGAAAIGSKIYIVGGVSSQEGIVLAEVECLDTASLAMSECEPLAHPGLGLSCCTLEGETGD